MKRAPITSWDQLPLVCEVEHVAGLFGCAARTIQRAAVDGTFAVPPMPTIGPQRQHQRWRWSREALKAYIDGGYLKFVQRAFTKAS